MKVNLRRPKRLTYGLLAFLLVAATAVPILSGKVFADGQVSSRSIQMSSSQPSATGVTYDVTFTPATTETGGSVIIDFCSNSPIPGDDCTATGGTDTPGTSLVTGTGIASVNDGTTDHTIKLSSQNLTASTPFTIAIPGITNPSTTGAFYARIFTYASTGANSYVPKGDGTVPTESTYHDYGGIALSTAAVINITAKVMETLSFCVYHATCGDEPSFTIGHTVGTATVLSSTQVDTATTDFSISTNAQTGADIYMKGDTLKNAAHTIPGVGSSAAPITCDGSTEAFGLDVSTAGSNITPTANYTGTGDASSCSTGTPGNFGFNTTAITGTYGDKVCSLTAPTNASVSTLTFAALASNTTPAGVYTATEQLIATGKF